MAIKMVAADLDRTLLREDKSVSAFTLETLVEMRRRGVLFVVATARPKRAVRGLMPWLEYDGAVLLNGAEVSAGEERLRAYKIDGAFGIAGNILRERPGTWLSVEMDDRLYSNMPPERLGDWGDYCYTADFREIEGRQADKLLISAPGAAPERWTEEYGRFIPEEMYLQMSESTLLMVMNRQATKLNGIRLLGERFGVELGEVAAFGDDLNDLEMLRECGAGVAVENALPEVKAAADWVCGGNEEDGVARWIRERVLK